jgi:hypothetical protein
VIVTLLPSLHRTYVVLIALLGVALFCRSLWKNTPRTGADVAFFAGWCALFAVVVAPSTRVGYLIYPINFFLWGASLSRGWMGSLNSRRSERVES